MSAKEVEKLILEKNKEKLRWDSEVCKGAKLTDVNSKKLKAFLEKAGKKFDIVENSLEKLNLMEDGKILNAAVILFGKKPENFFPNARLRCAVFGTKDTSVTIDMQDFYGDLFYLIEQAENYILKNIHVGMRLEGLRRVDVPEIDKESFREGIINAFCHRDYWKYDSVNIAVFKDRVEIRSPGLLYGGLTIERIKKENVSERRNELIAEMFHKVHFVEKWGRGISLILSKEPETEFKEVGIHFITVFKRRVFEKTVEKRWSEKWSEKWSETLSERQIKILKLIVNNPRISRKDLSISIGINSSAIQKHLDTLKKKNIIKRIGPAKGGHWEVKE